MTLLLSKNIGQILYWNPNHIQILYTTLRHIHLCNISISKLNEPVICILTVNVSSFFISLFQRAHMPRRTTLCFWQDWVVRIFTVICQMRKMMMKDVAVTHDDKRLATITDVSLQIISLIKDVHWKKTKKTMWDCKILKCPYEHLAQVCLIVK